MLKRNARRPQKIESSMTVFMRYIILDKLIFLLSSSLKAVYFHRNSIEVLLHFQEISILLFSCNSKLNFLESCLSILEINLQFEFLFVSGELEISMRMK